MQVVSWVIDLVFGAAYGWVAVYGLIVTGLAFVAAVPYGIWQAAKRLWATRPGGNHGHA